MRSWIRHSVGINMSFPTCRSKRYEAGKQIDNDLDSILTEARARGVSTSGWRTHRKVGHHALLKREAEGRGTLIWMQRSPIYHSWRGWRPCCMVLLAGAATSTIFVATNTKHVFCHGKSMLVATKLLSRQNTSFIIIVLWTAELNIDWLITTCRHDTAERLKKYN